jgi:hypothetical protein
MCTLLPPPLRERKFTRVPALASNVDPLIGAPCTPGGELPGMPSHAMRESPAPDDTVAAPINKESGRILKTWAAVAPAEWEAPHTVQIKS